MAAFPRIAADRQCIRQHCQPPFVAYPQKMNEGAVSWSATRPCDVSFVGGRRLCSHDSGHDTHPMAASVILTAWASGVYGSAPSVATRRRLSSRTGCCQR